MFSKSKTSCDSPVPSTALTTILLLMACCPEPGLAEVEIRYIDDQLGDLVTGELPVYSPVDKWSQGATCISCAFHPDAQHAFNHTWHDTTAYYETDPSRSVQFNFTGTSLQVFCILPNPILPIFTSTYNLTFTLDNVPLAQTFTHESDFSTAFQFNASVFYMDNLSQSAHTFNMSAASTVVDSTIQFDYAAYTINTVESQSGSTLNSPSPSLNSPSPSFSSPSPSFSSPSPSVSVTSTSTPAAAGRPSVATIAGATAGGISFLLLAIALSMFYCYRYKHRIKQQVFMSSLRSRDFENIVRVEPFTMREDNPQASLPLKKNITQQVVNVQTIPTSTPNTGSSGGSRNIHETDAPSGTGQGTQRTGNTFLVSNSTHSSRWWAEIARELNSAMEGLRREQQELRIRLMPPIYSEHDIH